MGWKTLTTLSRRQSEFRYSGCVGDGVVLDQSGNPRIDAAFFTAALQHFSGQTVTGGFREDDPPAGGFGEWVAEKSAGLNSRKLSARHGSFMAAILCHEASVKSWMDGNALKLHFPHALRVAAKKAAHGINRT
ncbi:MAG: hypothetical protein P4M04_03120 [Acidobacteriota bacterium]|nr:hypothetical protein [Acidobacteriota bacterium]